MKILSFKPGHDGQIAYLDQGKLDFSIEAEKDSFPRYDTIHPEMLLKSMGYISEIPDVMAVSGWVKGWHSVEATSAAGYFGIDTKGISVDKINVFGKTVTSFSSTHERSHLLCAYGMSPFPQGQPCYALIWEGNLGDFYYIDEKVQITHIGTVLKDVGNKYSYPYFVADASYPEFRGYFRFGDAGKLMALAAYSERSEFNTEERAFMDRILNWDGIVLQGAKSDFKDSPYYNIGVQSEKFKQFAGKFTDEIFNRFHDFAKKHVDKKIPLLIAGGCGLNCEWNTRWEQSGLFSDVFIPPCTNDSGAAIGTAIDAQLYFEGNAKIDWSVYAGETFVEDVAVNSEEFHEYPLNYGEVAKFLRKKFILGWVQDKYEIGPRALGNRSILAEPFFESTTKKLNKIKRREGYRPIAPICCEEDAERFFSTSKPRPYMLYFQRVLTDKLKAITHVDGTARVQSVNKNQNSKLYNLLRSFRAKTGYGVLCNTSLNFNGKGFINRTSDLEKYAMEHGLDGFVINDKFYVRKNISYVYHSAI